VRELTEAISGRDNRQPTPGTRAVDCHPDSGYNLVN
jgi:hypothetical protein